MTKLSMVMRGPSEGSVASNYDGSTAVLPWLHARHCFQDGKVERHRRAGEGAPMKDGRLDWRIYSWEGSGPTPGSAIPAS